MAQILDRPNPSPAAPLPPPIRSALGRLSGRVRRYITLEAAAAALVCLGLAFWLSLGIDWLFEPSRRVRIALLVLVGAATGWVVYRYLLARLFVPLATRSMAMLVERRFRDFRDGLLTAVELGDRAPSGEGGFSSALLERTRHEAAQRIEQTPVGAVFNPRPLGQKALCAIVLVGAAGLFAWQAPAAFGVWVDRALLLSDALWPRVNRLTALGLDADQTAIVAEGGDWTLRVTAEAAADVTRSARVDFRLEDGSSGRHNMVREGEGADERQEFTHVFKNVKNDIRFDVVGGDARLSDLRLKVVPNPIVEEMVVWCEFPGYTGRGWRSLATRSLEPLPYGTRLVVHGLANKELERIDVYDGAASEITAPLATLRSGAGLTDPRNFALDLGVLETDRRLLLMLLDSDGIKSQAPIPLDIRVRRDEQPLVAVQRHGVGTSVTAQARLPLRGEISDDYGIARSWIDYSIDQGPKGELPFVPAIPVKLDPKLAGGRIDPSQAFYEPKLKIDLALEVSELKVSAGQTATLTIRAADTYQWGPNVGPSDPLLLQIVTDEQLHALLEARELALRRQFEQLIKDMTDTRSSLAEITFIPDPVEQKKPPAEPEKTSEKPDAPPAAQGEPAEKLAKEEFDWRRIRVQRAAQNVRRDGAGTLGLAASFLAIREELINNRVDSDRHQQRIQDQIADPLNRIGNEQFPPLEGHLERLLESVAGQQVDAAEAELTQSLRQMDAVLAAMNRVLDQMLQLETFNEVLAQMRQLIDQQKNMNQQTKERHKEVLRRLLE